MGNEIYKELNEEGYNQEVRDRVDGFIDFIQRNKVWGNDDDPDGIVKNDICDIGSGNCYVASKLYADAYDYYPINNNVMYVDLTRPDRPYALSKYNNIILSHTLEHFEDPNVALQTIEQFVDVGSRLFISVPNSEYGDNDHKPFDKSIGHYTQFTRTNIEKLLNKHDYEVQELVVKNFVEYDALGDVESAYLELWVCVEKR